MCLLYIANVFSYIGLILKWFLFVSFWIGQQICFLGMQILNNVWDIFVALGLFGKGIFRFFYDITTIFDEIIDVIRYEFKNFSVSCSEALSGTKAVLNTLITNSREMSISFENMILGFFRLIHGSLVIIGECFCWLILFILKMVGNGAASICTSIIYAINAIFNFVFSIVEILIQDVMRLSIGICILILLTVYCRQLTFYAFLICLYICEQGLHLIDEITAPFRNRPRLTGRPDLYLPPLPRHHSIPLSGEITDEQVGEVDERQRCVVCLVRQKTIVIIPCKHLCLCIQCVPHIEDQIPPKCPLCRAVMDNYLPVYV